MEQNSILEGSPELNIAAPASTSEAPAASDSTQTADAAATPVRRRASRRVTAASAKADAVEATPSAKAASAPATAPVAATAETPAAEEAPKKRVSRARKKVDPAEAVAEAATEPADVSADAAVEVAPKKAPARRRRTQVEAPAAEATAETSGTEAPAAAAVKSAAKKSAAPSKEAAEAAEEGNSDETLAEASPRKRNTRSRSRKAGAEPTEQSVEQSPSVDAAETPAEAEESTEKADGGNARGSNGSNGSNSNSNDGQTRSSRTRQRERKRRGGNDDEPEITEDDVLLPVAGILDVLDNYAFVRTSGYLPGTGDVYVSLGQVKKYGLRKGDAVVGAIRQPREGDSGGRQKYNAIVKVDSINSKPVEETQTRPEFADFTPVHPSERLRLETDASTLGARVIDLFAPIGKGQRGFIVGPHESGKSTALRQIALAVAQNQPDAHLMLVVIDERPEDVTELQRVVNGEVIASTFDRPAEDHATIVELAVERAKRLVELGHDVIVLIDSLTSLARAYNLAAPAAVRVPAGSLDAAAAFPVKRLLSSARNIENGGSLTIIATVSAQPESKFDEAFLGEIEGVANMQLRLSGDAADHRVYPAIDLGRSSTRNEALLTSEAEARIMNRIRRSQPVGGSLESLEQLLGQLAGTSSNVEFLAVTQRQLDA